MRISDEIWNIGVASAVMMMVNAAMNPSLALMNTVLMDSDTELSSKLGYLSQSIMSVVSIFGALVTPWLRSKLGYRLTIALAAVLHSGLYLGMVVLHKTLILLGSVISGVGMGIIWVVIPDFVTVISTHEHIERNLAYNMFIYSFNGVTGNIMNYFCLEESSAISDESRRIYFTVCTLLTVVSGVVGAMIIKPTALHTTLVNKTSVWLEDLDQTLDSSALLEQDPSPELTRRHSQSSPKSAGKHEYTDQTSVSKEVSWLKGILFEPGVRALTVTNIHLGVVSTLAVVIPMCISNTYKDRHLIPMLGAVAGIARILFTGIFDSTARLVGYRSITSVTTAVTLLYVSTTLLVFPSSSLHESSHTSSPLLPLGPWIVYPLGVFSGVVGTWLGTLVMASTGKVARDTGTMSGYPPDTLWAYTMVVWSVASAVTLAISPYVSLYSFVLMTFVGAVVGHFSFCYDLIPFMRMG